MNRTAITIEASPRGVDRVVVHLVRDKHEEGYALLSQVLPALIELDQRVCHQAKGKTNKGKKES